ncbi:MAG: hypothetical protein ACXABY_34385 [Candidatus Thorarchaeota archaeon]|jgi:hypothetical protein
MNGFIPVDNWDEAMEIIDRSPFTVQPSLLLLTSLPLEGWMSSV